jgi:hypothetical protein
VVYNAIKVGYRLFDGAGDYGNEKEAGEGVRRALEEGIVKREELCERCDLTPYNVFLISFLSSHYIQGWKVTLLS